jgi:hypothetical protein
LERPLLETVVGMENAGRLPINSDEVAAATQLPPELVNLALGRLIRAGYLGGTEYRQGNQPPGVRPDYLEIKVFERGLRASGAWPSADPS